MRDSSLMYDLKIPSNQLVARVQDMEPEQLQEIFQVGFANIDHFLANSNIYQIFARYVLDETRVGFGELHVNRDLGSIEFDKFYPLSADSSGHGLKRKGVGTLAHVSTLIKLIENIPKVDSSYAVWHAPINISDERKAMLSSIGIGVRSSLKPYLKRIIDYAHTKGFQFTNPLK